MRLISLYCLIKPTYLSGFLFDYKLTLLLKFSIIYTSNTTKGAYMSHLMINMEKTSEYFLAMIKDKKNFLYWQT